MKCYSKSTARISGILNISFVFLYLFAGGGISLGQISPSFTVSQPNGQTETFTVNTVGATNTEGYNFPQEILLSSASFFESNSNVQNITLQANDADVGDTHSFGLVEGVGSEDNAAFTISGNVLSPLVSFDRSQKDTYSIRLSVVDSTGLSFDQNFSITILPDPSGDESGVSFDSNLGLVGWYPLNGNASDMSGNGNHGTVHGASLSVDRFGQENQAYFFDGVDDYIDLGNSTSLNPANLITVSAWVSCSSLKYAPVVERY